MSDAWTTIVILTALTAAIRASGPVLLGARELPPALLRTVGLLAPALLAALVVVETFTTEEGDPVLDARAAGLAGAAGVLALSRSSMLAAAVVAALTAAAARALG